MTDDTKLKELIEDFEEARAKKRPVAAILRRILTIKTERLLGKRRIVAWDFSKDPVGEPVYDRNDQ